MSESLLVIPPNNDPRKLRAAPDRIADLVIAAEGDNLRDRLEAHEVNRLSEHVAEVPDPIPFAMIASTLRRTIYNGWRASLGRDSAVAEAFYERSSNPRIGDMVIETSTVHYASMDLKGVGTLLDIRDEPVDFKDEGYVWDEEAEGRPHPTERVYYLKALDGRVHRWVNASIIAAVSGMRDLDLDLDRRRHADMRS